MSAFAEITHRRGAGLAGSRRRYALLVALLTALACVPTLIAATVAAAALGGHDHPAPSPFISRPAENPVIIVPPRAPGSDERTTGTAVEAPRVLDCGSGHALTC